MDIAGFCMDFSVLGFFVMVALRFSSSKVSALICRPMGNSASLQWIARHLAKYSVDRASVDVWMVFGSR